MSKLLEVTIYAPEFEDTNYYCPEEGTDDFSNWCHVYLETGLFMFNDTDEIFIFEQDLCMIPEELQDIAIIKVMKNNGPVENYE